MKKRFLHTCKNPICQKEFGILYDKAGNLEFLRTRCPHCKTIQKVSLPVKKRKVKKKR
jgi:phage FluMu protein Com